MSLTLMDVISARGYISIEEFRKVVNELYLKDKYEEVDIKEYSMQLLYYLDALGHCEFDFENRKVYICEPSMALLPGIGCLHAVLAGARDNQMIIKIREIKEKYEDDLSVHVIQQERDGVILPDVVIFEALDESILSNTASKLGIKYLSQIPIAWIIANGSCNLNEYRAQTEEYASAKLNWICRKFNPTRLHFQKDDERDNLPQLLEYTNIINQKKIYLYADTKNIRRVERDWGRYYILNTLGKNILLYDQKRQLLAVPSYVPLPKLLTRALTLCSGVAAREIRLNQNIYNLYNGLKLDLYMGINTLMAELIACKVGQKLNIFNFDYEEEA